MALLERVSTLIRANLNELIDKAEHPEIMIKQVILDMENQLLQVKTQVAIAIADQHLLEKKEKENEEKISDWGRKVEMLKNARNKLTQKREEARARSELLISQSRRARTLTKAADAQSAVSGTDHGATFDRMKHKVMRQDAIGQAKTELLSSEAATVEDRFAQMEKEDEISRILSELKAKRA